VNKKEAAARHPLALAFLGDAVWTIYIRRAIVQNHNCKVNQLHRVTSMYVNATAQSKIFSAIELMFSDDELDVANRARNANHNTTPKNCVLADYKRATAFEAALGYITLHGNQERVRQICDRAYEYFSNYLNEVQNDY
jgi:ribonuclease-3 family protein